MLQQNVDLKSRPILITGAAGFIGANLSERLLRDIPDAQVIGLDSVNDYYDVRLKEYRLSELNTYPNFTFIKGNLADKALIDRTFEQYQPQIAVNLAAQAGVRYSINQPGRLYRIEPHRFLQHSRSLPPSSCGASGVCFIELGLWQQQEGTLFHRGQGG